jgi:hypothetical protein
LFSAAAIDAPLWRWPLAAPSHVPEKVVDGVRWFNYAVIERGIYYIDRLDGVTRLQFVDAATGAATTVARELGEVTAGLAVAPDARTILYTRVDTSIDDLMLVDGFR